MAEVSRARPTDQFVVASLGNVTLATLAGMMVSDGKIKWTTMLSEVLKGIELPDYLKYATLFEICACSSGLPGGANYDELNRYTAKYSDAPSKARLRYFAEVICKLKPVPRPVTTDQHGQPGYYTTAVMLEVASGKSLEDLVQDYFGKRMGLTSVGMTKPIKKDGTLFGFQSHQRGADGRFKVSNYPFDSLTNIYMSAEDLVKLGEEHLKAWFGRSDLLRKEAGEALFRVSPQGIRTPAWSTYSDRKICLALTGDIGGCTSFLSIDISSGMVFGGHANVGHDQGGMEAITEVVSSIKP